MCVNEYISSECWSGQLVFLRGSDLKVSSGLIPSIEDFNMVFSNTFSLPRHQKLKHGQMPLAPLLRLEGHGNFIMELYTGVYHCNYDIYVVPGELMSKFIHHKSHVWSWLYKHQNVVYKYALW